MPNVLSTLRNATAVLNPNETHTFYLVPATWYRFQPLDGQQELLWPGPLLHLLALPRHRGSDALMFSA